MRKEERTEACAHTRRRVRAQQGTHKGTGERVWGRPNSLKRACANRSYLKPFLCVVVFLGQHRQESASIEEHVMQRTSWRRPQTEKKETGVEQNKQKKEKRQAKVDATRAEQISKNEEVARLLFTLAHRHKQGKKSGEG